MKVAVLFEHSGTVRDAFIKRGHDAISFDILSTEAPGPHVQADILEIEKGIFGEYDLVIAHPPCTHMAVSGNRYYAGTRERQRSANLIDWVWSIPCDRLVIENPVGQINKYLPNMPKPQYIQPWQFGHDASKRTGLWKRNVPDLKPTEIILKERYANQTPSGQNNLGPSPDRWKLRSKFYEGVAEAMADQWGKHIEPAPVKIPKFRSTMRPEWLR